jgi:hypothetical protein
LAWINRATQIILCHVKNGSWNIVLHKITQIWCRWTDKIWYSTQTQDLTQLAKLWLLLSINCLCVCVCGCVLDSNLFPLVTHDWPWHTHIQTWQSGENQSLS